MPDISAFVGAIFGASMHMKRIQSLSNATSGVIESGSLAIHAIGAGLAQANELQRKYAIKQVDRLLSNPAFNIPELFRDWVPFIVAERKTIMVSMDWTTFDADGHASLVLSLQTEHGRNTPLLWRICRKAELKGQRNDMEDALLRQLHGCLPEQVHVTIVADRGFSDIALYHFIHEGLGFDYVIRMKENIQVMDKKGCSAPASNWLSADGRAKSVKHARVTGQNFPVGQVICVQRPGMKSAWYLAASRPELAPQTVMNMYSRRWGIESSFRDIKDYKFGMGMGHMHTRSPERRDRLFLLSALSIAFLTLLGKAGDSVGLERTIKANTVKTRSYSFWRQGCIYYSLIPGMRESQLLPLLEKFAELMNEHIFCRKILGVL